MLMLEDIMLAAGNVYPKTPNTAYIVMRKSIRNPDVWVTVKPAGTNSKFFVNKRHAINIAGRDGIVFETAINWQISKKD